MSDDPEVDALVADRYLDSLLAAVDRHATTRRHDADLDPDVREAARVLRASLVRVHPSFRFEERLAGRLAELAATRPARPCAAGGGALIELPGASHAILEADPLVAAILRGELDPTDADAVDRAARQPGARRPLLVGGAITSAAISRRRRVRRVARRDPPRPARPVQQPRHGRAARAAGAPRAAASRPGHRHGLDRAAAATTPGSGGR